MEGCQSSAGGFEFLAIHFEAEGVGGDGFSGGGKMEEDETVGVASLYCWAAPMARSSSSRVSLSRFWSSLRCAL